MNVRDIDVDKINIIENVRQRDIEKSVASLMESIKQHGLLQPIGVSPIRGGKYDLVLGFRRLTAFKKLGFKFIPAVVGDPLELKELILRNTVENIQRSNVTPAEQGRICYSLMSEHNMTISELAVRLGVSANQVKASMDIFKRIPKEYRKMIIHHVAGKHKQGKIPASTANAILGIERELGGRQNVIRLLEAARREGFTTDHVKIVAMLLGWGHSIDDALRMAKDYYITSIKMPCKKSQLDTNVKKSKSNTTQEYFRKLITGESKVFLDVPKMVVKNSNIRKR